MKILRWLVAMGLVGSIAAPGLRAAEPAEKDKAFPEIHEAQKLSAEIDKLIAARWAEAGVQPAKGTGDGEFLRRLHLDLTGRIPRPDDLLNFRDTYDVKDPKAGERARAKWIYDILDTDEFHNHFATTWRQLILPPDNNQMVQGLGGLVEAWLRQKFKENAHYDNLARELLASPNAPGGVTNQFFQANEFKAENLAATTSRLFLGVKLECAQCHDHPFARWTRQQFWEYAAFYNDAQARGAGGDWENREIQIPGTERKVKARFLDGTAPEWKKENSTRETLAEWLLKSNNPFFAKAAVNRFWAHFFGVGLVMPVDDLSDQNPPSHPELLDLLAREFAAHDYDVRYLIRAIAFSRTYQLSSASAHGGKMDDPRLFARMNLKGLTGEQLYDSIQIATGASTRAPDVGMRRPFMQPNDPRSEFVARFTRQDNRTDYQTSILQALTMMNGTVVDKATNLESCNTLKTITDENLKVSTALRVEALYLAVLTRKPRPEESARMIKYVDGGGPKKDSKAALADVFWALLNSGEFLLNH